MRRTFQHESRCNPVERGIRPTEVAKQYLDRGLSRFMDGSSEDAMAEHCYREAWVTAYSWAIPTEEALEAIQTEMTFRAGWRIHDPMCGTGYWASLLRERGVSVIASDESPYNSPWAHASHIDDAIKGDAVKMVEKFCTGGLLLVWPPYNCDIASRVLKAFCGSLLFYVGENSYHPCTGDPAFHKQLEEEWNFKRFVDLPNWNGINDDLMIFERK